MFNLFQRPTHISLGPNYTWRDAWLAKTFFIYPWRWFQWRVGTWPVKLEQAFKEKFHATEAVTFAGGREALHALLKSLGVRAGDEVIVQAFTCVVVPNAVRFLGAVPVYADLASNSFNLNVEAVKSKLTTKTRAIIVQHTLGQAADIESLKALADEHRLILIEDCAHALGATYKNQLLGTFGHGAIFSFGRDKIISGVAGGLAITNDATAGSNLRQLQNNSLYPPTRIICQHLLHPIITLIAKRLYFILGLGKIIMHFAQTTRLLNKVYDANEKIGLPSARLTAKLPDSLASLAYRQWRLLEQFNARRQTIAARYQREIGERGLIKPRSINEAQDVYLRYNILIPEPRKLLETAKNQGIILGNWYDSVIVPVKAENLLQFNYQVGDCPRAEHAALQSVNLPTNPTMTDAQVTGVINCVNHFLDSQP